MKHQPISAPTLRRIPPPHDLPNKAVELLPARVPVLVRNYLLQDPRIIVDSFDPEFAFERVDYQRVLLRRNFLFGCFWTNRKGASNGSQIMLTLSVRL